MVYTRHEYRQREGFLRLKAARPLDTHTHVSKSIEINVYSVERHECRYSTSWANTLLRVACT